MSSISPHRLSVEKGTHISDMWYIAGMQYMGMLSQQWFRNMGEGSRAGSSAQSLKINQASHSNKLRFLHSWVSISR